MKIGIYGGCFNPPHIKHFKIAQDLLKQKYVDKVIYVPTGDYYNKKDLISFEDRYNMLKIMTNNESNIEVSKISKSKHYQYTCDVLDYFSKKYKNSKIYFICGSDNLLEFDTWKNHEDIIKKYYLLVVKRNNINLKKIDNLLKSNIIITNLKEESISSTEIRNNLNDKYLDKKVFQYIKSNKLYQK